MILSPEEYDVWLDPSIDEVSLLQSLLKPYPGADLVANPIGTTVNNVRNERPECIARV